MQHRNAPLTPNGRRRLVALVEEDGLTFEAAAAASNVARSTCWEWVRRWREATAGARRTLPCLFDRSSRPRNSPGQVPDAEARRICERRESTGWSPRRLADEPDIARPASTVHRVLRRGGCSPRPPAAADGPPGPARGRLRAPPPARATDGDPIRVAVPRQPPAHGREEAGPLR